MAVAARMTRTNLIPVHFIFTMRTWKIHVNHQALYGSVQKESAVHRFLHKKNMSSKKKIWVPKKVWVPKKGTHTFGSFFAGTFFSCLN